MANRIFNDVQIWLDDDGTPLNGGKITFYETGTVTLKDTYTDSSISTAHANPVILDANGRPTSPIWLNGEYKYKVTTSADVAVGLTIDNLNKATASELETGVTVPNGSFEIDTNSNGQPDSWTITPLTDATIAIDTSDSAHGKQSIVFTSGGNGGGTITSERFDVLKSGTLKISYTHKSASVNVLNKIEIKTYDKNDSVLSTFSAYEDGATNPTSYTNDISYVTVDATAVTAELIITGIDAASTQKGAGTTVRMDGISVDTNFSSAINLQLPVSSDTATTQIAITTGIPTWAKRVNLQLNAVSTNGTGGLILEIGSTTGGYENTGYISTCGELSSTTNTATAITDGFYITRLNASGSLYSGLVVISRVSTDKWAMSGSIVDNTAGIVFSSAGIKTVSDTLDRLRITTTGGTDTFDGGTISVSFE